MLPVLCGLAGALLAPIVALASPRGLPWLAGAAGLAATAAAVAGAAAVAAGGPLRYAVGGWPPPWGIELVLDPLSAFTAATVAGVGTVTLLTTGPVIARQYGGGTAVFYALALLTLGGLLGLVVSGDMFNVFVFLEVTAIAGYALVASAGGRALVAAFRYLILGTVGASFYLIGVGLLYAGTGTLNMRDLAARLPAAEPALPAAGAVFVVVGLAIKMGLFPLHGWLPDAYTHAPAPVAALLAPIGTKAAAYAVARILFFVITVRPAALTTLLAWAGAAAVIVGGVMALRQTDGRRLLAYSSVSQMGYIAIGLGLATPAALTGAYLHVLAHALMKAALFVVLGAAALAGRGVGVNALGRAMPVTAACALVAALSMVGIPPTAGFFSKWYLLQGAVEAGEGLLALVVLVGSLLAAGYMYRLTEQVWFPAVSEPRRGAEAPAPMLVGLVVLSAATVGVGLLSAVLVDALLGPAAAGGG